MADSETSENSKEFDGDRRKFTHEWATEAVIRLKNFAQALRFSRKSNSFSWRFHKWISDVLDSFFALDEQKDCFDFDCFKHPTEESVNVFDRPCASYHVAAKDVVNAVARAIWYPAFSTYDGLDITRQNADATRIPFEDVKDITTAFCNATNVAMKDVQSRLLKLGTGLDTETSMVNVSMTSDRSGIAKKPSLTLPTATAKDARNKWLYDEAMKQTPWGRIAEKLKKQPKSWNHIEANGCRQAAIRYAKKNSLPPPPTRNSGRPRKTGKK